MQYNKPVRFSHGSLEPTWLYTFISSIGTRPCPQGLVAHLWPGYIYGRKHLEIQGPGDNNCSQTLWLPVGKLTFHKVKHSSKVSISFAKKIITVSFLCDHIRDIYRGHTKCVAWPWVIFDQYNCFKNFNRMIFRWVMCPVLHHNPNHFFSNRESVSLLYLVCLVPKSLELSVPASF